MDKKIRIGAFISGGGSNNEATINACEEGVINGEVVFVGSDKIAKGLQFANEKGISTFIVPYSKIIAEYHEGKGRLPNDFDLRDVTDKQRIFDMKDRSTDAYKVRVFLETRAIAEAKLLEKMKEFNIDLLVLAGFMRNLTPYFIDRVNVDPEKYRIMNIHPALLPAFPGTDGYGDTFRYGCKVGGCTVHFIDYGEDSGPIIGQMPYAILPGETIDDIKKKGLENEWELYPKCIQLFAEGRLKVVDEEFTLDSGQIVRKKIVKILSK